MKKRAPRNRTLNCDALEMASLSTELLTLSGPVCLDALVDRVVNQDLGDALPFLPTGFVDLLILDPPYNLTKNYNGHVFRSREADEYIDWFRQTLLALLPLLRPQASLYVCSDWKTSSLIFPVLDGHLHVRNRITWERDKGRGAKTNWKNNTEDIWFCTVGDDYCFNVDDVKLKRRVIAPYRSEDGKPKDWQESKNGNYRLTHPSNIWSDITIPFWSMPENTDHPTQKPEKLIAKLIIASSKPGDFVFDPFLGSGTTAVVAHKLNRRFCGVELNREYCCWAAKRLMQAESDKSIQGYADGVFWERNSLSDQKTQKEPPIPSLETLDLFND
ncbi:MAG: site-specific DNA-methyltransferase [Candidatus Hydrogenedentes bacterium]|nr:site-specific DNA-methyltransferase [Candidatus Hydrogenedentota bacterium]